MKKFPINKVRTVQIFLNLTFNFIKKGLLNFIRKGLFNFIKKGLFNFIRKGLLNF